MQYVGFNVKDIHYGIASSYVKEILNDSVITPFPCAPKGIIGMSHYQGKAYPVLDINMLMDQPIASLQQCLILMKFQGHYFFVRVHAIPYLCDDGEEMTVPQALREAEIAITKIILHEEQLSMVLAVDKLYTLLQESFQYYQYPW